MKKTARILLATLVVAPFAPAATSLINIDLNTIGSPNATMTGAAVFGTAGDTWNGVNLNTTGGALVYSDNAASTITVTYGTRAQGDNITTSSLIDPSWRPLMGDCWYLMNGGTSSTTITLSGFTPGAQIASLVLYGAYGDSAGGPNNGSNFTYSGTTLTTTDPGPIGSGALVQGAQYVSFNNIVADNSGKVAFTWSLVSGNTYAVFNGMQISLAPVPEPATYGLLGAGALAGLAFVRRRRR